MKRLWLPHLGGVLLALSGAACAPSVQHLYFRPAVSPSAQKRVLVVQSADNSLFAEPVRVLLEQIDHPVDVFKLLPTAGPKDMAGLIEQCKPRLIVALGLRAAALAKEVVAGKVPVLFGMIPNHAQHGLSGAKNVMGVSLEPPAVNDFVQFKLLIPGIKHVVVFHSEASAEYLREAKAVLAAWEIEIVPVPIKEASEIEGAYKAHVGGANAVWLQNDPVVMNQTVFDDLLKWTRRDRVPLLASLSERFAYAGAVAAVSVDLSVVGSQLANMARRCLEQGASASEIGVEPPVGGRITVNLGAAASIGLEIPQEALTMVHEVVSAGGQPKW